MVADGPTGGGLRVAVWWRRKDHGTLLPSSPALGTAQGAADNKGMRAARWTWAAMGRRRVQWFASRGVVC